MRLAIMPQAQVPPVASPPSPSPLTQQVPDPICPHCHQTVPPGASFCANCGFSLSPSAGLQTRAMTLPVNAPQEIPPAPPVSLQQLPNSPEEHVQDNSQDEESVSNRAGQRLGNYQLMRLLGEGGFAEVYLGEHIHLGSQAAIKVLHSRLTSDERERFRQEARTLVRLVHPHIVRVLDFGIEDKTPFLVMDYAANGTLRERHPKGTRLPLATIITYVKQVADALQYAHDQKIIHRDIKPENILVGRQHEILLSDFGIATVSLSSRYQNDQDMAGTVAYMAPEQIQAHPRPASDQYALGVVIYEWLCGTRPFQGSFAEIAVKHAVVPPPSIRERVPTLPPTVEEVVFKALAKDPKNRFENMWKFAQALEQAR
jgi:eukaryotic-like serine/threonine-protein kinase